MPKKPMTVDQAIAIVRGLTYGAPDPVPDWGHNQANCLLADEVERLRKELQDAKVTNQDCPLRELPA